MIGSTSAERKYLDAFETLRKADNFNSHAAQKYFGSAP
jgi:hypothetical protein